jgi:predicted ABC-type ATPase
VRGNPPLHLDYSSAREKCTSFFWLPNADVAVRRVALRVASGGHSIPEDVIRRRFERGIENFFNAYAPIEDSWLLVDNTAPPGRPIAWRDVGEVVRVEDNLLWTRLVA